MPRPPTSLRLRLTLAAAVATAAVLTGLGVTVYVSMRASLVREFDDALLNKARMLTSMTAHHGGGRVAFHADHSPMPEFARPLAPEYFQVVSGGQTVARAASLRSGDLPGAAAPRARSQDPPADEPTFEPVTLPDGRPGRQIALRFVPHREYTRPPGAPPAEHDAEEYEEHRAGGGGERDAERDRERAKKLAEFERERAKALARGKPYEKEAEYQRLLAAARRPPAPRPPEVVPVAAVLYARDTVELDRTLEALRLRLTLLGAAAVVLSAGALALVVHAALRPVSALAGHLAGMRPEDLGQRIELPGAPAELVPVVGRLNDLLDRLGAAFDRERSFSADVAHELRTPLAEIRTTLEVTGTHPRHPADYRRALQRCLAVADRMGRMVDNLLLLARAEARQLPVAAADVDVAVLARDAWVGVADRAAGRGLRARWLLPDSLPARTDADKLQLILRNLLDNAVSYADAGGDVVIDGAATPDALLLRVRNTGCALTPEDLPHVFERFWRRDAARNLNADHHGLGLPLCQRLAAALGGALSADLLPGQVFQVTLTLPPAPPVEAAVARPPPEPATL